MKKIPSTKMTLQERIELGNELFNSYYDYSLWQNNDHMDDKVKIICPEHGIFMQNLRSHLKGHGCFKCCLKQSAERSKLQTVKSTEKGPTIIKEIQKEADLKYGKGTYSLEKAIYINKDTKFEIICKKHGSFWQNKKYFLQTGKGCPKCTLFYAGHDIDNLKIILSDIWNNLYDYSMFTDYTNAKGKIPIICPTHGLFYKTVNMHKTVGCPKCRSSYGEKAIIKFLTEKNIEFETQKIFKGLHGPSKTPYRFDFYLAEHNILLECDGEAHRVAINFGGRPDTVAELDLLRIQKADKIKNEWAKSNNIFLIRLLYNKGNTKRLLKQLEHELKLAKIIF